MTRASSLRVAGHGSVVAHRDRPAANLEIWQRQDRLVQVSFRSDIVRAAIKEWQEHPEGRPAAYAADIGADPHADWCGYFALWCLHRAGVAKHVNWIQGDGFIAPQNLQHVDHPMPGDIVYVPSPFQHQAILVSYEPTTGMVTSIDGNQPGIKPKVRFLQNGNLQFYSIQPLVAEAERTAATWGYIVAGAAILGAAAWAWLNPGPTERALRRIGL